MKLNERFPSVLLDALVLWNYWRTMGYTADEIHLVTHKPKKELLVQLHLKPHVSDIPHFIVDVGSWVSDPEDVLPTWNGLANAWNGGQISDKEMTTYRAEECPYGTVEASIRLVSRMQAKGLPVHPTALAMRRGQT